MGLRSPHHQIRKGLKHPDRLVAAAARLLLLAALVVLVGLATVLAEDFWVIAIAWMQP